MQSSLTDLPTKNETRPIGQQCVPNILLYASCDGGGVGGSGIGGGGGGGCGILTPRMIPSS